MATAMLAPQAPVTALNVYADPIAPVNSQTGAADMQVKSGPAEEKDPASNLVTAINDMGAETVNAKTTAGELKEKLASEDGGRKIDAVAASSAKGTLSFAIVEKVGSGEEETEKAVPDDTLLKQTGKAVYKAKVSYTASEDEGEGYQSGVVGEIDITVNALDSAEVTIKEDAKKEYTYGEAISLAATDYTVVGSKGEVTLTYYTDESCENKTTEAVGAATEGGAPVDAGTYYVKAAVAEDDYYAPVKSAATAVKIQAAALPAVTLPDAVKIGTDEAGKEIATFESNMDALLPKGAKASGFTYAYFMDQTCETEVNDDAHKKTAGTYYVKVGYTAEVGDNYTNKDDVGVIALTVAEGYKTTVITMEDVTVDYNGKSQAVTATCELDGVSPAVTYYTDAACTTLLGQDGKNGPVNAGVYYAKAVVAGTDAHSAAEKVAKLTINKIEDAAFALGSLDAVVYTGKAVVYPETEIQKSEDNNGAVTLRYYKTYESAENNEPTTPENSGAATEGGAPVNAGTYYVVVSLKGDVNYLDADQKIAITIAQAKSKATLKDAEVVYNGKAQESPEKVSVTEGNTEAAAEEITYTYYKKAGFALQEGGTIAGDKTNTGEGAEDEGEAPSHAGEYMLVATIPEAGNYAATHVAAAFTIKKAKPVITVADAVNDTVTKAYTGGDIAVTATTDIEDVTPEIAYYDAEDTGCRGDAMDGAPTAVGCYNVLVCVKNTENLIAAEKIVKLEIKKGATVLTFDDQTVVYDGSAKEITAATKTGSTADIAYTYYTDEDCKVKTTEENSGAAEEGAAPENAGTYYVMATVAADDNYTEASKKAKFTIDKADSKLVLKEGVELPYTGEPVKFPVTEDGIADDAHTGAAADVKNIEFKYFTMDIERIEGAPVEVGEYYVMATAPANDNYKKVTSRFQVFTITKATPVITSAAAVMDGDNPEVITLPYTGAGVKTDITADDFAKSALKLTYYAENDADCEDEALKQAPVDVGTYYVKAEIPGSANYTAAKPVIYQVVIEKADAVISVTDGAEEPEEVSEVSVTYTGKEVVIPNISTNVGAMPAVAYYGTQEQAEAGADEGKCASAKNAGVYYARLSLAGTDNYNEAAPKIIKVTVDKAANVVTVTGKTATYTGAEVKATAGASNGTPVITYYSDEACTKVVETPQNAGTYYAKAAVAESDNYKAGQSGVAKIVINKASQSVASAGNKTFTYAAKKTYALKGSAKTAVTYKTSDAKVATVSKSGVVTLKGAGKCTITISATGDNNYNAADKKVTITVKPAKGKVSSVKNQSSKKMTVKWSKGANVDGYQIKYTTGKKSKTVTVKGGKTTSKTISKLSKGKTYKVQVRAYKKISGKNVYGSWSANKSVKIKK